MERVPQTSKPFLSPLVAGVGLGVTLFGMFVVTAHGLGGFGLFRGFAAWLGNAVATSWASANGYFAPLLASGNPLNDWITWETVGIAIGALVGSVLARRFKPHIERGSQVRVGTRLGLALFGGILTGMGAALARGCTSGTGLSGSATLAVAGFVFLLAFFVTGILVSMQTRRLWE
ncbi:YeeE/YedE thiosulfate transporter family protein [Thiothrix winogradskyi]|uniref:YeeE/YedE family protein n=1 Tax=Thiothrix winogradskyi TaxID=96472 RepID=A0ABY3T3D9_9GAMM|nr:YeeE/YedE thiosulfate transporter family protein [Thiothrix winogradskyi]UJS26377.1 YeeE/YedE family protein [Thiothrix winogradskyi]